MSDPIKEAQELYQDSLDCLRDQRKQIEEDLKFSDPSDPQQWDETEKNRRESDPGGARPCLVFDQCGQYVSNVAGQAEQRPPSLHAIPVGGGADKKVAEQLDGFFRHIEYTSRAQQHYARSLTSAARTGVGYLIVRPEYTDRALNYQEPRISSEGDPLRVVFDPWSVELDGSDATHGFLLTPLSHREFERKYGKAKKISFSDLERAEQKDARESVVIAEGWRIEDKTVNMVIYRTETGDEASLPEDEYHTACQRAGMQLEVLRTYSDKSKRVLWAVMSGDDYLTKEVEYPASGIGLVPMYGYVGWASGRMTYCGIPRRAMSAQRAYNFHQSEMRAFLGGAIKSPWMVPIEGMADGNVKDLWDRASVEARAWMPYRSRGDDGQPIPAPSRTPIGFDLGNHMQGAERALSDIQASIGMYQANLGAPSNESSGVAIESRKQQGEASTAHFPAHSAASVGQAGKLCMEMIPRLIDTKRQLRILGLDGSVGHVEVDPDQKDALQHTERGISINPNVGRYDVRVVVGASFSTQRNQTQAALSEVMGKNPALTPAIAPLWAQTLDIPNADKLAQVLTAVAPPEVKAILNPSDDKTPNPADLIAQAQQLSQQLQEATQIAHEAQQDHDAAMQKLIFAEQQLKDKDDQIEVERYKAETDRLKVTGANDAQIKAIVADLVNQMLEQESAEHERLGQQSPEVQPASPDDQGMNEPAEPAPPQPSPEFQALMQSHGALLDQHGALTQSVAQALGKIAGPRTRVPVRDKQGNLLRVVEQLDGEAE